MREGLKKCPKFGTSVKLVSPHIVGFFFYRNQFTGTAKWCTGSEKAKLNRHAIFLFYKLFSLKGLYKRTIEVIINKHRTEQKQQN